MCTPGTKVEFSEAHEEFNFPPLEGEEKPSMRIRTIFLVIHQATTAILTIVGGENYNLTRVIDVVISSYFFSS